MPEAKSTRLEPRPAWTVVTDAPLRGLALAREAGTLLAWDEGDHLYLFGMDGERRAATRAPGRILAAAISDDGALIAVTGEKSQLWLLGRDLGLVVDRATVPDPSALAVDPHGRYVAVSSRATGRTQLSTRHGRPAGLFETRQPMAHLAFVAGRPMLLGTSSYGTIAGVDLTPGGPGGLQAEVAWQTSLMSNVGRLAVTGDGGIVLASCFNHGIQRYDLEGQNEGAYHLGGTAAHAVPDFAGRTIVVATLEGELAILNQGGNVRWKSGTPRPAVALEVDALGRFFVYGMGTGEVTRVDLDAPPRSGSARGKAPALAPSRTPVGGSIRRADWSVPLAPSDEQAETAVLAVLDDPPRVGALTSRNQLQVFRTDGKAVGEAPEIVGLGRLLRTCPGWIVSATDRMIALYDARRNEGRRLDISMAEVTHLEALPESFGLAIVQERDRLGRVGVDGLWAWRRELDSPVEDVAIGPDGLLAATTEDGRLRIFGPGGDPVADRPTSPPQPLALIEAPEGAPGALAFVTLAGRLQALRGHGRDGQILWEAPTPWEGWRLLRVGPRAVVLSPDGRALAFDATGRLRDQSRDGDPRALYFPGPGGQVWRVSGQGTNLICTDLDGRINWRVVTEAPLGPMAAGRAGVAALLGRQLAWFGTAK